MEKRTWAEIDLDALAFNMRGIRRITNPNALIMAVVKADAYGHGVGECARTMLENGADRLAAATLNEAVELKRMYPDTPVMTLGSAMEEDAARYVAYGITPAVYTYELAKAHPPPQARRTRT